MRHFQIFDKMHIYVSNIPDNKKGKLIFEDLLNLNIMVD